MQFEVPYNFDEALIPFYRKNASFISYLYLPPFKDDLDNTRTSIQTRSVGRCYMPPTRQEYDAHLRSIHDAGLRYVVLWQVRGRELTTDNLDYYSRLGASGFIVADDMNARNIKEYRPDLMVICSIVQRTCADIIRKNLECYDHVILYYPFNRAIDALKRLDGIKEKIILMPNTMCNVDCPSIHHWFPQTERPFDASRDCPMTIKNIDRCGIILPEHLGLFDDLVGGYKLQGREYPTPAIKYICSFYFKRTAYDGFVDPFFEERMATCLKEQIHSMTPECYYNVRSRELIETMDKDSVHTCMQI